MNRGLVIIILVVLSVRVFSQNDVQISQYMFSEGMFNPAYTGMHRSIEASLIARQQWTDFDKAPSTQLFSVNTYLDKIKGGIGLLIINDRLGYEKNMNVKLQYSYRIRIKKDFSVRIGGGIGMLNKSLEGSKLLYENMNDDRNAIMTDRSLSAIDIDLGAQIYYRKLQAGFSSTHLQQSEGDANTLKTTRHYYGYLKYIITASEKVSLIPTVLMKATGFINQYDINCTGYYNNEYWAGLSYRTEKAVVMMLGLNILKDMRLGYSYDFNFGELRSNSSGSHEIMLAYKFKDINRHPVPLKSPRFF